MTRLTREGIVRRERKGQYRFADPLLEIYVDRVGLGSAADEPGSAADELRVPTPESRKPSARRTVRPSERVSRGMSEC